MVAKRKGDLQDGMLAYYLSQAKLSDATVEARIEREPFDFRDIPVTSRPVDAQSASITPEWLRKLGNL